MVGKVGMSHCKIVCKRNGSLESGENLQSRMHKGSRNIRPPPPPPQPGHPPSPTDIGARIETRDCGTLWGFRQASSLFKSELYRKFPPPPPPLRSPCSPVLKRYRPETSTDVRFRPQLIRNFYPTCTFSLNRNLLAEQWDPG